MDFDLACAPKVWLPEAMF